MKSRTPKYVKVHLVYLAFRLGDAPKGHAVGEARLTPTTLVVEKATVVDGRVVFVGPYRFKWGSWMPTPYRRFGWQIERVEKEGQLVTVLGVEA